MGSGRRVGMVPPDRGDTKTDTGISQKAQGRRQAGRAGRRTGGQADRRKVVTLSAAKPIFSGRECNSAAYRHTALPPYRLTAFPLYRPSGGFTLPAYPVTHPRSSHHKTRGHTSQRAPTARGRFSAPLGLELPQHESGLDTAYGFPPGTVGFHPNSSPAAGGSPQKNRPCMGAASG